MEPSKEPISVRIARLNNLFIGCGNTSKPVNKHYLSREGLCDALIVLYDECNNETLKKDKTIALFIDKFRGIVSELRQLRVSIADFEVKDIIGRGHFGEVKVVREKQTGDVYAMKIMRKADTLQQNAAAFYEEERDIMALAKSPWLTSLQYAFQDMNNLYLVMEFHPGGDLLALLERFGGVLSEEMTRFYLAELVLALRCLHTMGYVHRDIKPDNILLDRCGHLKLADFGSAAKLTGAGFVTSQMPVGTPEYIAPEVLNSTNNIDKKNVPQLQYGVECDYWSLGIVAYEMVVGRTPFCSKQLVTTYANILNHKNELIFPSDVILSKSFRDVVEGLLTTAASRFGYEDLIKHYFFTEINWNNLRESVPPFVPVVNGVDDTSNFDEFSSESPVLTIENFKTKKDFSGRNLPFIGFTYSHTVSDKEMITTETKTCLSEEDLVLNKNKEIEELQKKLFQATSSNNNRNSDCHSLEKKVEDYKKQIKILQNCRNDLELQLEKQKLEYQNLKRVFDLEREDRKFHEEKVVSIIRDTKLKWEVRHKQEISEMQQMLEVKEEQITQLNTSNNMLTSKVECLKLTLEEIEKEKSHLQEMLQECNTRTEKAREQARQSMFGAESCIEKISQESQGKLSDLQKQLDKEVSLRIDAECKLNQLMENKQESEVKLSKECEMLKTENYSLTSQLEEYTENLSKLEKELIDLKNMKNINEKNSTSKITCLEENLAVEKQINSNLQNKLASLESDLSRSIIEQEVAGTVLASKEAEYQAQIVTLEKELKIASEEHVNLQKLVQDAAHNEAAMKTKVDTMEQLLQRLEQGLNKLENENIRLKEQILSVEQATELKQLDVNSDLLAQKNFLETQIEKLESQLEKLRESSVVEREAAKAVQSKLWQVEGELANAKIDIRIAKREAKTTEENLKTLLEEKKRLLEKCDSDKIAYVASINVEREKQQVLEKEIAQIKEFLSQKETLNEQLRKQIEEIKNDSLIELKNCEQWKSKVGDIQKELMSSNNKIASLEKQISELRCDLSKVNGLYDQQKTEKSKLEKEMQLQRKRACNAELNLTTLKEACSMMEEQLEDFEKLTRTLEEKQRDLINEKNKLTEKLGELQIDLKSSAKNINEEKTKRICAEKKLEILQLQLTAKEEEVSRLQIQVADFKSLAETLTAQMTDLDNKYSSTEINLKNLQRQLESRVDENNMLKEEATRLLTQIHSLKESNFHVSRELEDSTERVQAIALKYAELKGRMEELQAFHKNREIKSDGTIQQQTKLIEFLQKRLDQPNKKKKTFADKFFGSKQKENIAPGTKSQQEWELLLSKEREKVRALSNELSAQKSLNILNSPTTERGPFAVPNIKDKISSLSKQKLQRGVAHRFHSKMCMRITKCCVCLDSIHFGRNAEVCEECNLIAHPKCALVLPKNCGSTQSFPYVLEDSLNSSILSEASQGRRVDLPSYSLESYVKLPNLSETDWEQKYLCLEGSTLLVFNSKPVKGMKPVRQFEICPVDSGTSVFSAVPCVDVVNTSRTELPYILKVEVTPYLSSCPTVSFLIMALNFPDKHIWVQALEKVIQQNKQDKESVIYHGIKILSLERSNCLDINCCYHLSDKLLILGAKEGLFSYNLDSASPDNLIHIDGVTHVHQVDILPHIGLALMIAGETRTLMQCDLRSLKSNAEAAKCSKPNIHLSPVLSPTESKNAASCHLFAASTFSGENYQTPQTILCVATPDKLIILRWTSQNCFIVQKVLESPEPCSCIHFSQHSILVGCNKFFEIDIRKLTVEEFLDSTDCSLAHAVYGTQQINSFPIAILDVAKTKENPEYLLCFNEFGVFVDQYGQRTREDDIKWSHLPFAFVFRKPYLFIIHCSSVEVMRITSTSFTRGKDDSLNSAISNYPEQLFIEYQNPRFIGIPNKNGSVYIGASTANNEEVFCLEGNMIDKNEIGSCSSLNTVERESKDLNSCGSSEFSFTSSIMQSLDGDVDTEENPQSDSDSAQSIINRQQRKVTFDSKLQTAM